MQRPDSQPIGGVYRINKQITNNNIFATYTAYNLRTSEIVTLHTITLQSQQQLQNISSLLDQLNKRKKIHSPHILRIHDWGTQQHLLYIATDPPRGSTLQHIFDNEDIDIPRAIDLTRQIATGIQFLHEQDIAGLDLRPQLITVETVGMSDRVQIDDVGLRDLLQACGYISNQRQDDIGFLDPRYAPPEYINAGPVGPWSDIYQVGLLLFAFITGRLPFVGRTPAETGTMQTNHSLPSMRQYKHDTPELLQKLVETAMSKSHTQRFRQINALINALNNIPTQIDNAKPSGFYATTEIPKHRNEDATMIAPPKSVAQVHQQESSSTLPKLPTEIGLYAYLITQGEKEQRIPIMQENVVIGRRDPKRNFSPDIDLSHIDPTMTISRRHIKIRFTQDNFYIEDLRSHNKTRLGEQHLMPFKEEKLQHGSLIQLGSIRLRFEIPGMDQKKK